MHRCAGSRPRRLPWRPISHGSPHWRSVLRRWVVMAGLGLAVGVSACRTPTPEPDPHGAAEVPNLDPNLVRFASPVAERVAAPKDAPNVVLLLTCTVRKDQTSLFSEDGVTPELAEWSAGGVVFQDVVAAAPWTRPAAIAVLTGRHALSLGVVEPGPDRNDRALPNSVLTMAERFGRAGWRTLGVTANPNLNRVFGLAQGLDHGLEMAGTWAENPAILRGQPVVQGVLSLVDEARLKGTEPVFLQVTLVDSHAPYPPSPDEGGDAQPDRVRDYRAALGRLDRVVARLLRQLASRGFTDDNTVFVWVSDHGEGLSHP